MIVVAGEALIDVTANAGGAQRATPGGGPFNTARALARLGAPTAFLGHLSEDAFGRELKAMLEADGANLELVTTGKEPTTTAFATIDGSGAAHYRFDVEGTAAPQLTPEMLPARLGPEVTALHVGTLGMVLQPMASTLAGLVAREHEGRLVMLDPNIRLGLGPEREHRARLEEVIAHCTLVKASDSDLAWLYDGAGHEEAAELLLGRGVRLAVVTLGPRGALAAHGKLREEVPGVPVEVVDTIGAGDAFGAALLAWLHEHDAMRPDLTLSADELRAALQFACQAAAITCSRAGADPPWRWEVGAATPSDAGSTGQTRRA